MPTHPTITVTVIVKMLTPEQELNLIAAARNAVSALRVSESTVIAPEAYQPLADILANIDETREQRVLRLATVVIERFSKHAFQGVLEPDIVALREAIFPVVQAETPQAKVLRLADAWEVQFGHYWWPACVSPSSGAT